MYRFENPAAFQLLLIIPVVLILFVYLQRRQRKLFLSYFSKQVLPLLTQTVSTQKKWIKVILQALCLALMIFALTRPQGGKGEQKLNSEGVEVVLLMDVSNSMLAEDVKPSRLHIAKKEIQKFINQTHGDRVGLIAFAGNAVVLSPVTQDKGALNMFIDSLSPDIVTSQGTNFKGPLEMAEKAFQRGGVEAGPESTITRVIVIVSDGEDNETGALELAKKLSKKYRIFTLGVGTEKGAPIPVFDRRGNNIGYKKDKTGTVVLSRTKGTVLKNLAHIGRGSFYHITIGGGASERLIEDLNELEKSAFETSVYTSYNEYFQVPLLLAILLGLIELILGERKSLPRTWMGRFSDEGGH